MSASLPLRVLRAALLLGLLSALSACGQPAGTACSVKGSGFSLRDSCSTRCLSLSTMVCPDTTRVSPAVCAGRKGCKPGSCPADQVCYSFEDPMEEVSYCVPANVCPSATDAAARAQWEQESAARADAALERFRAIQAYQQGRRRQPLPPPVPASGSSGD